MATANIALDTNFNVEPYYDDYSPDKDFHRILYRPGRAVQARELTQQQTILQNQITRFGQNIFKEGSEVSGGSQFIDNVIKVDLQSTYAGSSIDVTEFEDKYARSRGSEILFYVKKVTVATGGTPDRLYLQTLQSANSTSSLANNVASIDGISPRAAEVLDFSANSTLDSSNKFTSNTGAALIAAASPTYPVSNGFIYHVDESVFFTAGFFVRSDKQSVVIPTSDPHVVGFNVVDSTVDSTQDTTLLDPADGSFNYTAPGADRLKFTLTLTANVVSDISVPNLTSSRFIEVARVQNFNIASKTPAPNFNILGDVLARRTFDESGHYIVDGLTVGVSDSHSNSSFMTVAISPGKAFVKGFEINKLATTRLSIPKSRDTEAVTEQNLTGFYGNYVVANTLSTGLFDIGDRVELNANTTPVPQTKIGEASIKNIELESGTDDSRKYKIFLYDVTITSPELTFDLVKSIAGPNSSSISASALVHTDSISTLTKFGQTTSGANTIVVNNPTGISRGQLVENNTHFPDRTVVTAISFDTITVSQNALLSNTNAELTFSSTSLTDKDFKTSVFKLPNKNVVNVTNVDYKFKRKFATVTFTAGAATIQTLSSAERFSSATGSLVDENYIVVVKTGATGALANGENVDLTAGSRSVSVPSPAPGAVGTATIDLDESGFNGTCDIIAAIDVTGDSRRIKSFANNVQKTFDPITAGTKHSLGFADVRSINAIYEGNTTSVNTSSTVVTSNFNFDNGQRDTFYDHATIQLKTNQANTTGKILVDFNRFSHGGGRGPFDESSYPLYASIPTYEDSKGEIVQLRDSLDFRPIRTADASSNVYSSLNKQFDVHQVVDSQTFEIESDYNYYLKQNHTLTLDEKGRLIVNSGASRLKNPPTPPEDPNKMTLATFKLNPFTYNDRDMKKEINRNVRFTMKDIGDLETRIERIEAVTALNSLESSLNEKVFRDADGNFLFKNGFLVDSFDGHAVGDVFNPDYNIAIDRANRTMHAPFESDSIDFKYVSGSSTLQKTGSFLTVPYSESNFLRQNVASRTININPFHVTTFVGSLKLTPDSDVWVDFETRPVIIQNDEGNLDHLENLTNQQGTEWGNWRTVGQTTSGNTRTTTRRRDGVVSRVQISEELVKETTNVLSEEFSYFMRSRRIEFEATGMRPNTKLYVFMDGINISDLQGPSTLTGKTSQQDMIETDVESKEIISDRNGSASGFFFIPSFKEAVFSANAAAIISGLQTIGEGTYADLPSTPSSKVIRSGTVPVLLTDNFVNTLNSSTIARAEFTSEGTKRTTQTTRVMQKKYDLVTSSTSESDTTSETISRPQRVTTTVNVNNNDNKNGEGVVCKITVDDTFFIDSEKSKEQAIAEVVQASPDTAERNRLIAATSGDPFQTPTGPGGASEEIVTILYEEGLGRKPDEAGWKYWNDQLLTGIPASTVMKTAFEAARENNEDINEQAFLDRIEAQENAERILAKTGGACTNGVDPIAQTFLVNEIFYPEGIFVTSVDLFFSSKDDNLPVRIEIRPTVNGFPSSNESIPLSKVTKLPSEINIPSNQNTPVATNFAFDSPIQLPPGEYALVILTDSIKYNHYICRIGEKRLGTDDFITSQPTLGSLFKSQNARTFTAAQEDDLMFTLKKASFTTGSNFIATLSANNTTREEYSATGNTVGKFDIGVLNLSQFAEGPDLSSLYEIQTKTEGGSTDSFVAVSPNKELFFDTSKEITADSDLRFRATFQTTDTNVSPYLDLDTLGFSLVKNKINTLASITSNPETSATGGGAIARYITRKVTLAEGFNATALKVFLNQNMPEGATIQVYAKVLNENDETSFVDREYQLMTRVQTNVETNEDIDEFEDFEYRLENINYTQDGVLYQDYNQFAIKIVMFATNDALAPTARNLRAIALS